MSFCVALLLGLAVAVASVLYGGLYEPVFTLPSLLLLAGAGGFLTGGILSGRIVYRFGGAQITLLLLAAYLIGRAFTLNSEAGILMIGSLAALSVIYQGGAWMAEATGGRWLCLGLLVLMAFGQIAAGIPQMLSNQPDWPLPWLSEPLRSWYAGRMGGRLHGFYLNPNHLAWFLNFSGLFALSLALWARIRAGWKIVLLLAALGLFAGSFQTLSRGGLIGLGAGLLALLLISSGVILLRTGRARGPLLLLGGGLAICLFFLLQAGLEHLPEYSARLIRAENEGDYRQTLWPAAFREFQTAPVWGTGPDTFKYYGRMYREDLYGTDPLFAHNDWLQFTAEYGMVGLLLLLTVGATHFGQFWRDLRWRTRLEGFREGIPQDTTLAFKFGAIAFLTAGAAQSFFDFNLHLPANLYLTALALGWVSEPPAPQSVPDSPAANPVPLKSIFPATGALVFTAIVIAFLNFHGFSAIRQLQTMNAIQRVRLLEATAFSRELIRLRPGSARAWHLRGQAALLQGNSARFPDERRRADRIAAGAFDRAIQLEPEERAHYLNLGDALLRLGMAQRAWRIATQGVALDPLASLPYQYAAMSQYLLGNNLYSSNLYRESLRLPRAGNFPQERLREMTNPASEKSQGTDQLTFPVAFPKSLGPSPSIP